MSFVLLMYFIDGVGICVVEIGVRVGGTMPKSQRFIEGLCVPTFLTGIHSYQKGLSAVVARDLF